MHECRSNFKVACHNCYNEFYLSFSGTHVPWRKRSVLGFRMPRAIIVFSNYFRLSLLSGGIIREEKSWHCWMFIHLNNTLIGRNVHTNMNRCTAEMDVNANNNIDYIVCWRTIRSMHAEEFSQIGLDFHHAAFANATTFLLITASRVGVLEDRRRFGSRMMIRRRRRSRMSRCSTTTPTFSIRNSHAKRWLDGYLRQCCHTKTLSYFKAFNGLLKVIWCEVKAFAEMSPRI